MAMVLSFLSCGHTVGGLHACCSVSARCSRVPVALELFAPRSPSRLQIGDGILCYLLAVVGVLPIVTSPIRFVLV